MATTSYQTQLEEVQAAISALVSGGQSYSIGGRSLTRADLQSLLDWEAKLRIRAAREASGGIRVRGATPTSPR